MWCSSGGIELVELPTTTVSDEDTNDEEHNHDDEISYDSNLQLLKECNDHFKKSCDNGENKSIDASADTISPKHHLINKLYFLISHIRRRENLLFKQKVYRNFDKYLFKLREDQFFQN